MSRKLTAAALRGFPELLNVKNIQEILNISRTTAYALIQSGELKSIRIRHNYRIPKAYLIDYLNKSA